MRIYIESVWNDNHGWWHLISQYPINNTKDVKQLMYAKSVLCSQYFTDAEFFVSIASPVLDNGNKLVSETEAGVYIVPLDKVGMLKDEKEIYIISGKVFLRSMKLAIQNSKESEMFSMDDMMEGFFKDGGLYCIVDPEAK